MMKKAFAALLSLTLVLPQFAAARYTPKPGMNLFSVEQDVQLGKEYSQKVEQQVPILNDARITQYVQRLGQRLAAKAPGPEFPYTFKVVNQKEINAFALPGGPIYVNLGTIQAADTEAQLAGVIGHEIGHVVMRHSTNQASKQMMVQAPLAILGGKLGGGAMGQLAQLGIGFGIGSVFLKYSRDAERQSDLVATGILNDAGFDPRAMAQFFEKLQARGGKRGPQFLSTHPDPGNRAAAVSEEAATLPRRSYSGDSSDFREIKQRVGGMKGLSAEEAQRQAQPQAGQGAPIQRPGNIEPSANMRSLAHSGFTMSYPENWQVQGDQSSSVTIAPQGGTSGGTVAYGVIVNHYQPQQQGSLEGATREIVAGVQQGNPQMKQVGNTEDFKLNGVPAKSLVFLGPSPIQGEQERDWLVTLQRADGNVTFLVFVSPERDFKSLQPRFEKMLRSVRLK